MHILALLLACITYACLGRRRLPGSAYEEPASHQIADATSRRWLRRSIHAIDLLDLSQSSARAGIPKTLQAIASILLSFNNAAAGWQVMSKLHNFDMKMSRGAIHACERGDGLMQLRTLDLASRLVDVRRSRVPVASSDEDVLDDEEDDGPVHRWLELEPELEDIKPRAGATVMPVFPSATHLPYSRSRLHIFEPRYRAMFNDILFSGARRFVVCDVDEETGDIAEVGVVFYLEDLQEVSEKTEDEIKYIGDHSVRGRVRLKTILNPRAAVTEETYLRAEVEDVEDIDEHDDTTASEAIVSKLFDEVIDAQKKLDEDPRFSTSMKGLLNFTRGKSEEDPGLWGAIQVFQQFREMRCAQFEESMEDHIEDKVVEFLESGSSDSNRVNMQDDEITLDDLPEPLVQEINTIQRRYREELEAMDSDPDSLQFQAILQSTSHAERLSIFKEMLHTERKRLAARAVLKSMFKK